MTTKALRYENFTCDICHKKQRNEIEINSKGTFTDGITYTMSATWFPLGYNPPTEKTNKEEVEMCSACKTSFDSWRASRLEKVQNNGSS